MKNRKKTAVQKPNGLVSLNRKLQGVNNDNARKDIVKYWLTYHFQSNGDETPNRRQVNECKKCGENSCPTNIDLWNHYVLS